ADTDVHPVDRWHYRKPPSRQGNSRSVSTAFGRDLLVPRSGLRQEDLGIRRARFPRDLPGTGRARRVGALTFRERRSHLDLLRPCTRSDHGTQAGLFDSDANNGAETPGWSRLVRPLLPESGYDAQGRVWKSDRAPVAVRAAQSWKQCFHRWQPATVPRP